MKASSPSPAQHSATPRTDRNEVRKTTGHGESDFFVESEFARQLERENAELVAALENLLMDDSLLRHREAARAALAKATGKP